MTPDFAEIQQLVSQGSYEFTLPAQQERPTDDLDVVDIGEAIGQGEVLEEYPNDPRGWSCLVLGYAGDKAVHMVLGWAPAVVESQVLRVITVYIPQSPRWRDPRTRGDRA